MKLKKYIKNLIKYVLYDFKPKKVYVNPKIQDKSEKYKDKVILVTGGSDGIGLKIANAFSSQGANVIITGRNIEKLKEACKSKSNIEYIQNDISNLGKHKELYERIIEKYGRLDILISNAGISNHENDFFDVSEKSFDEQFNINLKAPYFLSQLIIKDKIQKNEKLTILYISSERGNQCDYLPYGLTKVALNSLMEGLSCKYVDQGIRINAIAPGVTASNMVKVDKNGDLATDRYISGRFFLPEEIAEIALFICSDNAVCISGEVIHTNNGNHLNPWFK